MLSAFFNLLKIPIIMLIIICLFFVPVLYANSEQVVYNNSNVSSIYDFMWPIPNYTNISSPFGMRTSPTAGASSYHSGIDIPAPEGTSLYAIADSTVIFASWGAGGGYTITLQLTDYPNLKVSYCHVSPIMYVKKDDIVSKGTVIGTVGPKNVFGINNNPYKDASGNPTNGATTGCHLHFAIKNNKISVNPLNYYDFSN